MGVPRSSFYRISADLVDDTALVERMHAIQAEFSAYGYRRITAQLHAEGMLVNRKRRGPADASSWHAGSSAPALCGHDGQRP
jgi:hypothetical protein